MAYLFDSGSNESLFYTSGTISSTLPGTVSAWCRPTSLASNFSISGLYDKDAADYWSAMIAVSTGALRAFTNTYGGGAGNNANTGNADLTVGQWSHGLVEFTRSGGDTSVEGILDGDTANAATSTATSSDWANHDRLVIGQHGDSTPGAYANAYIAEVAYWTSTLNASEKAALAQGFSPLLIQPHNLVFYAPLWNNTAEILDPNRSVTVNGTPVASPGIHPPMIYPAAAQLGMLAAAGVTPGGDLAQLVNGGLVNSGLIKGLAA